MKLRLFLCLVLTTQFLFAQEIFPESKISNVTVFLSKAQVTRAAKTRLDEGKSTVVFSGLTSLLDKESIQVSGKGSLTILGINTRQNYLSEFNKPKSIRILEDSLEFYKKLQQVELNQKEILSKEEQLILSNQKIGGTQQNITVAELKAMADFFRTRLNEIGLSKIKSDEKIKKYNESIARLNRQYNEQNDLRNRNTSEIVVSVQADASTAAEFEVNYVVANAGWVPVYDLRAINTKSPVQLNYKANVFQNTGEEWKNVKLVLSTANPNLGGVKPDLYTWYLDFYQPIVYQRSSKPSAMKRQMAGAPAEMSMDASKAEEEVLGEVNTVADYVSTIQTTLNTEFAIALPYTVTSSNKPTLVDIRNYEMKASYQYATAPKLDADAFLLAKAVGWEEFNLLPGEANVFFEGTFVAKTFIDPNNIKDTLSVSLGRDQRIVVKREKLKDYTTRKTIGTNQRDSYAYEISVRNTKNEAVKISVEDQIPVSQISQIEVTATDLGGAKYNATTGKLIWELTLQPNETRKVAYKFEVKYPKDRQVSGL